MTTDFQLLTVSAQSSAQPIITGESEDEAEPVLVVNMSTTVPVYVGFDAAINPNNPNNTSIIPPNSSTVFDGTEWIYATVASGSAQLGIFPGVTNYFQLLQVAQLIAGNVYLNGTGLYIYDGTPAFGNPPILWAVTPGTTQDPFGNPLPASGGIVTEDWTANAGAQLVNGSLLLWGTTLANIITPAAIEVGHSLQAGLLSIIAPIDAAGLVAAKILMSATAGFGQTQILSDQLIIAQSATQVTPETTDPLEVQGFLAAKGIESLFGVVLETWHTPTLNPADFTAGGTAPRYQYEGMNGGRVRLGGSVNLVSNQAAGSIIFTVSAGYAPLSDQWFICYTNVSGNVLGSAIIEVDTSGNVRLFVAGTAGNFVVLDGITWVLD